MSGYRIKPWEELTIRDDYMFKLIMSRKRICKQMLERLLHIEIADLSYLETEKTVTARYHSKGVRLDVYVKDDAGTVYNIEMQVRKPEGDGLPKRTRYYQSMMDVDLMALGADYDSLNPTIIIFICPFDPFDAGRYLYTFENRCVEDTVLRLRDDARKIFLNTKGMIGEIDSSIKAFLQYVDGVITSDRFVQEIDEEIQKVKMIEGEAVGYMTYEMKMKEERKEGIKEGRKEGRIEAKVEDVRRLIAKLKVSAEQAMDLLEIPQTERPLYRSVL